jgi:hypothetical protein
MCLSHVHKLIAIAVLMTPNAGAAECVVLLHGLARSSSSMNKAAEAFETAGYTVANVDYPSRKHPVEALAPLAIDAGLAQCPPDSVIHFLTHSLGGILLRYYLERQSIPTLGRVVMLAPPNQGSEVVDRLRNVPGFKMVNGPAGLQLGTDEDSIPSRLGPVEFEVGVIAGTETFNPILSQYLANPDDGKVSVENTKVEGMSDFITVPRSHPFIMQSPAVISQSLSFIQTGRFDHTE